MAKTKPIDYLTTYQAVLKISGYLKTHYELNLIKDAYEALLPGESSYPIATFKALADKYKTGYYAVNSETGYVEAKIEPAALPKFLAIMARIEAYTTNR